MSASDQEPCPNSLPTAVQSPALSVFQQRFAQVSVLSGSHSIVAWLRATQLDEALLWSWRLVGSSCMKRAASCSNSEHSIFRDPAVQEQHFASQRYFGAVHRAHRTKPARTPGALPARRTSTSTPSPCGRAFCPLLRPRWPLCRSWCRGSCSRLQSPRFCSSGSSGSAT